MIAIDLGSNTLRVLEYDCKEQKQVNAYEKVVKTADGLAKYGVVNDAATRRVIEAIQEAQTKIDFSSTPLKAVTTEAVRRATNADEVLRYIKKETGVSFTIISGEEEARLTLLAVKNRLEKLQYASESFVLVDIGGGSTELVFHFADETISKSFPIGIVTIAQTHKTLENIEKILSQEMSAMQIFCEDIFTTKGKPNYFVATAGTPTTVAAMKLGYTYATYDAQKINGTVLDKEDLDLYLGKLLAMTFEAREVAVGTGRSDLVSAGILIYRQIYTMLGFESCVVVDDGLREGVALDVCNKL